MPRPEFEIWKNKPFIDASGQYHTISGVEEYYAVGFDTDDGGEDDIYTIVWPYGRTPDGALNFSQTEEFRQQDYLHGVGKMQITNFTFVENWRSNNHYNDTIQLFWVDSADFQCPTGVEPGCENGPIEDNRGTPTRSVDPITGTVLSTTAELFNNFISKFNILPIQAP